MQRNNILQWLLRKVIQIVYRIPLSEQVDHESDEMEWMI